MICRKCGSQINDNIRFCPVCGQPSEPADRAPDLIASTQGSYKIQGDAHCPNCGAVVSGDAPFCGVCGAKLAAPAPDIKCPNCGYPITPELEACPRCGFRLKPKSGLSPAAIALICGSAVAVAAIVVVLVIIFSSGSKSNDDQPSPTPTATISVTSPPARTAPPTPEPTRRPTPEPERQFGTGRVLDPPSDYSVVHETAHGFTCVYPSDFASVSPEADHKWVSYAYKAPDSSGYIYIGGAKGKTAAKAAEDFVNTDGNGGTKLIYETVDGSYCKVKTSNSSGYHFAYFDLTDGKLRGFEVHYDSDKDDYYTGIINEMLAGISCD